MKIKRKITVIKNYTPFPVVEDDEIFSNGIFRFNISKIVDHIQTGEIKVEQERINIKEWYKSHHFHGTINEEHLPTVDVNKTIIQAEISPNVFTIIDGNHRMEKAYREGITYIDSYKLMCEQFLPYFVDIHGYEAFVDYWNSKLKEREHLAKLQKQ